MKMFSPFDNRVRGPFKLVNESFILKISAQISTLTVMHGLLPYPTSYDSCFQISVTNTRSLLDMFACQHTYIVHK